MKNKDKYKTAEERLSGFKYFCLDKECTYGYDCIDCVFTWLELEAEEDK